MTPREFSAQIQKHKQAVQELEDVTDREAIELTIKRLKRMSYSPTLIFRTPDFLTFSKSDILQEIERISDLSDEEMLALGIDAAKDFQELKAEHIALLVYHFKQLLRLRRDEAEAWDEIEEIFGDD